MSDLTLYRVTPDTAQPFLVLGREAAEALSLDLAGQGWDSVSCEAVPHGSQDEQDAIAYDGNGCDLGPVVLPLGLAAGLDIDPENFDPYALLLALREMVFCVECGVRIARAEQDARAGHRPTEPRCYGCGSC